MLTKAERRDACCEVTWNPSRLGEIEHHYAENESGKAESKEGDNSEQVA